MDFKPSRRTVLLVVVLIILVIGAALFWSRNTDQAAISLESPSRVTVGQVNELKVSLNSEVAINAAEIFMTYDPSLIEVTEIDKADSIFSLWIKDQPSFDNQAGSLTLAGGLPTPGWQGSGGLVAKVKYRAKKSGAAQFSIKPETRTLANDGQGSSLSLTKPQLNLEISE